MFALMLLTVMNFLIGLKFFFLTNSTVIILTAVWKHFYKTSTGGFLS